MPDPHVIGSRGSGGSYRSQKKIPVHHARLRQPDWLAAGKGPDHLVHHELEVGTVGIPVDRDDVERVAESTHGGYVPAVLDRVRLDARGVSSEDGSWLYQLRAAVGLAYSFRCRIIGNVPLPSLVDVFRAGGATGGAGDGACGESPKATTSC